MNRRVLLLLGVVLLLGGAIAAACSSGTKDLEDRVDALEQQSSDSDQMAALQAQVQTANMIAALNVADAMGIHEANETIAEGGEPPEGINGRVLAALRAAAATQWPADLQADAQTFEEELQTFYDALANRETSDIVGTALAAHNAYHEFTGAAWTMLGDMAGVTATDSEEDMQMDMTTPEMDMTTPEEGG